MKITISGILNETPFTLSVWASRLVLCQGIMNNFKDELIQGVIDFKDKRDVDNYDIGGYFDVVDKVWNKYSDGQDFNSAYWGKKNRQFTSDFIMKLAGRRQAEIITCKIKKVAELEQDLLQLKKDVKNFK